jgi:alkylation response protein AidB-like acyl-CoA dehydrogenase
MLLCRRDLDFLLYEWLDAAALTQREDYALHSRETLDAVLDLAQELATREFAPHNRRNDVEEPLFDGERVVLHDEVARALTAYREAGFFGLGLPLDAGGMQLPMVASCAAMVWFQAANIATSAYPLLTTGNANLLLAHGSAEQVETWVRPMADGRFFGTMCLSEPQAGSSLADISTRAERQDDGSFRLFGNKMWISGGDHELAENIVHLVLAKIPGGLAGAKGISLFLVPKVLPSGERNDVVLGGVNHKMGYRGTVNALVNFGEGRYSPGGVPGAVGWLVGGENRGLAAMFHMMNEARLGVGLGATALGYSGYLHALEYARSRPQGRRVDAKDPRSAMVPIVEHPDVRRMLLASKSYVEGALALNLYCARLLDEERTAEAAPERERAHLLLETLTPIAKSWPSQWCLQANDLAIQVHGGYGYTRDYPVEQLYRDNRLNPIHEGTHGIQALDLLGRKVVADGGAGLALLAATVAATAARAEQEGGELAGYGKELSASMDRVVDVTGVLWRPGDAALALANASVYLEAAGHVVIAWVWLEQLLAVGGQVGAFYDGKRAAARYFFGWELPRTGPQLDLLASLDRTTLDLDPDCL